jgi:hypothetical protein
MNSNFEIQPIGRFVGQSAAIKRPKVSSLFSYLLTHGTHNGANRPVSVTVYSNVFPDNFLCVYKFFASIKNRSAKIFQALC